MFTIVDRDQFKLVDVIFHVAIYHSPHLVGVKCDDPELPAFYYDPVINPIVYKERIVKELDSFF